ncbi:MAG: extracellular solute-binding protein [Victivallales bacterium]|nr:extracellular solute-binding protein [Victivallales bacterium]
MSLIAYSLVPPPRSGQRKDLVWTTDPNPQRGPQVDAFNKMFPEHFLRIDPDNSQVMKVVVQSSAGMGPDISDVYESTFQTYLDAGILLDVTEKAKEMGFGPDTLHEEVRPFVLMKVPDEHGDLHERQFIYPCNVYHSFMLYNKNIFDKYNVPYPPEDLTWDKYIEIAKRLTVSSDPKARVPSIFGTAGSDVMTILWGKGGKTINDDGTRSLLDTEEAVDAFMFKHDLLYRHKVEPTPTEMAAITSQGGWGGNMSWFGEGKVAMFWGSRWMLIQFRRFVENQTRQREEWLMENPGRPEKEAPEVLRMGACLVPRFEGSRRYTPFGARCNGINKMSKNIEGGLCFLQFLTTKEYSRTINEGADSKPGNMKYNKIELFIHPDWPDEVEVHEMSLKAVPDSFMNPRSQFIPNATINRIFWNATENLIATENITRDGVRRILQAAAREIDLEIARTIKRNPRMTLIYNKMLKNGAEPIRMQLEEIGR